MTNPVLDIIIELIKGVKKEENSVELTDPSGNYFKLNNAKYLLGQVIRQYHLPREKFLLSKRANELWNRLTSEDIFSRYYRCKVVCDRADGVKIKEYKNNGKQYVERTVNKNESIIFRDVFHDEHTVSVRRIIQELTLLPELTYEAVQAVLDKIYICKMLKEEDRAIKSKVNREIDLDKNLELYYKEAGIEII